MPTISPSQIPTKSAGTLFSAFTGGDSTLNIRWLVASDPLYFQVLNRATADVVVRQLVLAKAVDNVQLQLGHQTLYPFLIQPRVSSGTTEVDVPTQWIWDIHASLPKKWENLRLAKIKRIAGENGETNGYSGWLRLIFTANIQNSSTEVAVFSADYQIDSSLTYQLLRLTVVDSDEESTPIDASESETVTGFVIFKTLDVSDNTIQTFLDTVAPPSDTSDNNSDGFFDNPAIYEITDTVGGGSAILDDYSTSAVSHGTGIMVDSSWNAIPELDSDAQSWITSFNYPFDADANRKSTDGITIPNGLFKEFDIAAPAGDEPDGDTSGLYYPVWVSRIERVDTGGTQLRFYFSTYNVTDSEAGGSPSTEAVEFASMDLLDTYSPGEVVEIVPTDNLMLKTGSDSELWEQGFGRGHAVLSNLWSSTTTTVQDFFDEFDSISTTPADTSFSKTSTRLSSFGVSRIPKYIPTVGQSRALLGSTSRLSSPVIPSYDNRYVTEEDQGLGDKVDLEAESGITPNTNIERYGHTGSLNHRVVKLVVDTENLGDDSTFYDTHILPRLTVLFGRQPQFGDFWFNGSRLLFFNGDTWQG